MILNSLNKILARGVYFKLIVFSLVLQLASLFRSYPLDHPCGRVLNIYGGMEVLINCDSAVYMKDAQSAGRLFNGDSVYQDRPLPTLLVSISAKLWHFFNLPDYYRNIVGNSGVVVTYSLVTYVFFLLLSASILSMSCWLGIKTFSIISNKFDIKKENFTLIAFLFTILISMNEITKTFFWTPGSQMFNIFLPVYLFYLLQHTSTSITTKFFILNIIAFTLLLFSYAFFILMATPLILLRWKSFRLRVLVVSVPVLLYAAYPSLLRLSGETYNNYSLGYRRLYLWIIDSYFKDELIQKASQNLLFFVKTFPIFPTVFSIVILSFLAYKKNFIKLIRLELVILLLYFFTFGFYGYYSRRLTYPIMIFIFLIILKIYIGNFRKITHVKFTLIPQFIIAVVLYSWIFTNGPLI